MPAPAIDVDALVKACPRRGLAALRAVDGLPGKMLKGRTHHVAAVPSIAVAVG